MTNHILDAVRARFREDRADKYDDREPPTLEMLGDDRFIAHRFVDRIQYVDPVHYIVRGRIVGDTIELAPFYVYLSSADCAHYDQRDMLERLRANDLDGAHAIVARIRAPSNPACTKCGSQNTFVWERFFGWAKYTCNDCGHEATE